MTELLVNYILIYAIITVIATILILWRGLPADRHGRKDRNIILIIAGAGAIAIGLFYLFYIPALDKTKTGTGNKTGSTISPSPTGRQAATRIEQVTQASPANLEIMDAPKGPFPTNETVTEKERQIGRLFNIWRQSILTKNISQINQLDSQIKACGDEAIPFLTKLAKNDGNERVRAFSVRVLGRMNITELSSLFIDRLHYDTSPFVRENCAWALGRLGNTEVLENLQRAADSDPSAQVRKAAGEAIEMIKSNR